MRYWCFFYEWVGTSFSAGCTLPYFSIINGNMIRYDILSRVYTLAIVIDSLWEMRLSENVFFILRMSLFIPLLFSKLFFLCVSWLTSAAMFEPSSLLVA